MPNSYVPDNAARSRVPKRRWLELAVALLGSFVLAFLPLSAQAATPRHRHRRPAGSIKLPSSSVKRTSGLVCGKVDGRWLSGSVTAGYFLSDARRAHNYAVLALHSRAGTARLYRLRAQSYSRRARTGQRACARALAQAAAATTARATIAPGASHGVGSVSTPAPAQAGGTGSSSPTLSAPARGQASYVPPQVFGQHLMFNWGLNPAIPVHAMRLWDSNASWCDIDNGTASNRFSFGQLDALLAQASGVGADVAYTFGNTPQWAATGAYPQPSAQYQCGGSGQASAPASESYWTDFVTALVTHGKGRIHAYELWNEADYAGYWTGGMDAMIHMSVDAAAIIHRIDPSALVLSPSITATQEGYAFLRQYLALLPSGTIDAIAIHSYTAGAWPEDAIPAEMSSVRAALPSAYADTPIWSTEGGWGLDSQFSTSPSDQRAFVARYDLQLLTQGVARSYWYAYQNTQWGTLWDGSSLTPAGVATGAVEAWLAGATLGGCASTDGNLWTCSLTTPTSANARIVWVRTTPVPNYSTSGFSTLERLDGSSSPTGGGPITVGTEPVMLST